MLMLLHYVEEMLMLLLFKDFLELLLKGYIFDYLIGHNEKIF